ncbi:MAG: alpha-L-rhamnosidase [Deltaproteobacteria bacterium]|nr:alpha-L-rhamnosidase [Deltaproteobacteria bacterium]
MTMTFAPGRWRARWIWAEGQTEGRQTVALRRSLALRSVPASAPARLCAISRYALHVNGRELARGPVRANPRRQPYDVVDLAPHLREGENVIGVLAWRYGGANAWFLPPPAGSDLRFGAFVFEARVGGEWLASDESWSARVLDGWGETPPGGGIGGRGTELVDLRSLPADWCAPGGADPGWPRAVARRAMSWADTSTVHPPSYPGGPLAERPIAYPGGEPVEADGQRVVVGTLLLDAQIPAGETLTAHVSERVESGAVDPRDSAVSVAFVGDGTRRVCESLDLYGGRGIEIDSPPGAVVHSARIRERLYPVAGGAFFQCSDARLDALYAVGRRTVTICSLDSYVDCPTREQRAWTGDSVVHQMVDLTTNADWRLARWHPALTASPRPDGMLPMAVAGDLEQIDVTVIPDWALHWVHSVHNLYRYVGSHDEIARLLPVVEGVLRWFEPFLDEQGCAIDVFGWVLIDWSAVYTQGVCGALNGLLARALLEFAEMAAWAGDAGRARWALARHAALARGFERLWDGRRGRYVDSLDRGERLPMVSQHTQAAALVGGLVPDARVARVVAAMTDEASLVHAIFDKADGPAEPNSEIAIGAYTRRGPVPPPWWDVERQVVRAQPFFRYVVHDALAAAGRADLIPAQLLDWDRWAMKRCSTSFTECWAGGTVSHGWSATPTRDLVQRVLGITPAEPGFAVASIAPELGPLEWARGSAPCPAGPISVDVRASSIAVESPVPFDFGGRRYPQGSHRIARASTG